MDSLIVYLNDIPVGWLVSDGELNGTFRIWVVGPKQGGMLLVR